MSVRKWLNLRKFFTLTQIAKNRQPDALWGSDLATFLEIWLKIQNCLRLSNLLQVFLGSNLTERQNNCQPKFLQIEKSQTDQWRSRFTYLDEAKFFILTFHWKMLSSIVSALIPVSVADSMIETRSLIKIPEAASVLKTWNYVKTLD